jgi:small subunit ribosomal protein S1
MNVVILDFDEDKTRIQLGLKQLEAHPWDSLDENTAVGDKIKGKVVVLADYGAFVEIIPGVEGLIHVSEMSWSTHLRSAQDFMTVGDEVEAVVLTLDREDRKMSLGIKQLSPDPWTDITTKFPVGSTHTGTVRNYTNFGVFVELEEGIDGLVYISDLSWTKKIKHPSDFVTVGQQLEVQVLELDVENRKLNLGHKQTQDNPWDAHEETYTIGSIHEGLVKEKNDKGAVVTFDDGVKGFAPSRFLEKEDGTKLNKGETLKFIVIEFSKEYRRVVISHTSIFKEQERKNIKAQATKSADSEKTTLGDIGGLAALKEKMEAGAKKKKKK